jgi:hypothetical protein
MEGYAGIDVAFAKRKLLPVCVCCWIDGRLVSLPLRKAKATPPRGQGNAATLIDEKVLSFAEAAATYLHSVESEFNVRICRIAIDAPSDPKKPGLSRRRSEQVLDARRIRCITTPSADEFHQIKQKAVAHLASGGLESRLPHANQLWMLVGFALFARLRQEWECLEVFPQATAALLNSAGEHKTTATGLATQLKALARYTHWPEPPEASALRQISYGSLHDCLDAYSAAWIASLNENEREPLGEPPHDVIWVPRLQKG